MTKDTVILDKKQRLASFKDQQYQYDMFMRGAKDNDMNEWNNWRKNNSRITPQIFGFDFCNIDQLCFMGADLSGTIFINCNFKGLHIIFFDYLVGSQFIKCNLNKVHFSETNLQGVVFKNISNFEKTCFTNCDLRNATFDRCNLNYSCFISADFRGTYFRGSNLSSIYTQYVIIDQKTLFEKCTLDTDATSVGLKTSRVCCK